MTSILGATGASAQPPAHLDIRSAVIVELPPIDSSDVANRRVVLRIEVTGSPTCGAGVGFLAYGFLIDADKNASTGLRGAALENLGVDAEVSARCDPATGHFHSPVGTVVLGHGSAGTLIEIATTVQFLPSIDFRWIAFAQESSRFFRLPREPGHGAWFIHELWD